MLTFRYDADALVEITNEYIAGGITRNDFRSMDDAAKVAADATEFSGELHIAIDSGRQCYPRFDVIRAPAVGDVVSRGFNGDYYPSGTIVKVSPSLKRVETDEGAVFYRRRESGTWLQHRTFALVQGTVDRRNPSF